MRHFVFERAQLSIESLHSSIHVLGLLHLISIDLEHFVMLPRLLLHDAHHLGRCVEVHFHEATQGVALPVE